MSGNMDPERVSGTSSGVGTGAQAGIANVAAGKIYPMDLAVAPQKITIVKSAAAAGESKLHLVTPQGKPHLLSHGTPISLVRPAPQIISQGVASQQPQMLVSGAQLLSGNQLVNQSSQIISQSQIIGPSAQLLNPPTIISQSGQIISQGTQIISQGSQLLSQPGSGGAQVLSVGGGGVVVTSGATLRSLPSMRVLPPSTLASPRPASSVTVTALGSALGNKGPLVGMSSHVPRGPAAGASLAVPRASARPVTPTTTAIPVSTLGWSARAGVRGPALVYPARVTPRAAAPRPAAASLALPQPITSAVTSAVSSSVTAPALRTNQPRPSPATRAPMPPLARLPAQQAAPRLAATARPAPLPVLQRNFQPAKVVTVGARTTPAPVRSALYYEVTRTAPSVPSTAAHPTPFAYSHTTFGTQHVPAVSMTVVPVSTTLEPASSSAPAPIPAHTPPPAAPPRPSILRKRDIDGSPSKPPGAYQPSSPWSREEVGGGGGSTTESAASSPAPDDEPPSPPRPASPAPPSPPAPSPTHHDISPRKKPRKQMLSSEVRQCEFQNEEPPPSPPAPNPPPPRRSMLGAGAGWEVGYRATALHFTRPSEVRRREPRAPHVLEIANEKHVLTKANGWKVHHLTAQMDDLVELEAASVEQLRALLRSLDTGDERLDAIMELVKGNMQRSKIVCEDMREAKADILRVFTHRTLVADILARQADKRCFRKHRASHA